MADNSILVDVAYAEKEKQMIVSLTIEEGGTLGEAVELSGIKQYFPHIDLAINKVGVFGKICNPDQRLSNGDRVEIYRPLARHPMEARRNRASGR